MLIFQKLVFRDTDDSDLQNTFEKCVLYTTTVVFFGYSQTGCLKLRRRRRLGGAAVPIILCCMQIFT